MTGAKLAAHVQMRKQSFLILRSYPFDLPNDSAYSETCAAISLAFFARRMLEIEPESEYADVMERAMYTFPR